MNDDSLPRVAVDEAPPTPAGMVGAVDVIHGVDVHDPFRWLEDDTPERSTWLRAQDRRARRLFASLPERGALLEEIQRSDTAAERVVAVQSAGPLPRVFMLKQLPGSEAVQLWVRDGWSGDERRLFDPTERDTDGLRHALDFVAPSPEGRYVALGVSTNGSEDSVIEILDAVTGSSLPDRIDRCQYAHVSWRDERSFFHWRRAPERPGTSPSEWFTDSATYLHHLGDDHEEAAPLFGAAVKGLGIPQTWFSGITAAQGSDWLLGYAIEGTRDETVYYRARRSAVEAHGSTAWQRFVGLADAVVAMVAHGDRFFALSRAGAERGRVLELPADAASFQEARVVVPESGAILRQIVAGADGLYLRYLDTGRSRIARLASDGSQPEELELPFPGAVHTLHANPARPGVHFDLMSWTVPHAWYAWSPGGGTRPLELSPPWPRDDAHLVTEFVEAESDDGTLVPLTIVRRLDTLLDGSAPALLAAYGSYGVVLEPTFLPERLPWIDRGGVFAFAGVRGGGERGTAWHQAGAKLNKERGVEDFIACAHHLSVHGYTSPERTWAVGTSAGGLVIGGAITRAPEAFGCATLRVPVANLVRFERTEGGPANVPEFGTVGDPVAFAAMLASDPFHRVRDGVRYPGVLVTVSAHDIRVPVWEGAKFAARLQAASTGLPVVLRVAWDGGHRGGPTRSAVHEEWADLMAFALWCCEGTGARPST